jgi:tetratricopeptide (TPR) repeat protein
MNFVRICFLLVLINSFILLESKAEYVQYSEQQIAKIQKQAQKAITQRNYEEAIVLYTKIIDSDPSNIIDFLLKRAALYTLITNYPSALEDYKEAIRINPYILKAYFARGLLYLNKLRNFQKALEDLDKCVELSKNKKLFSEQFHNELIVDRAIAKLNLSLDNEGGNDCLEAAKHLSNNPNVFSCLAIYYGHKKKYDEAITYADKLVALAPSANSYYVQGFILTELERNVDALNSLSKSIELGNKSYEVFYAKSRAYRNQKKYQEALEEIDKAILNGGKDKFFMYGVRGSMKWRLKDLEGALADYNKAIELKKDDFMAYSCKCETLEQLNRLDEALVSCNKSIELQKDYPNPYQYRARVYKRQLKKDLAISDAKIAKSLYEAKPPIDEDSDYYLLDKFIESLDEKN